MSSFALNYFCIVRMKLINRFLVPLLLVLLVGYFRLDIDVFQGKQIHGSKGAFENQEQFESDVTHTDQQQTIKPTSKSKRKKRCKAIVSLTESQEEDNDDDDDKSDGQNSLSKYVKNIGLLAIFTDPQVFPSNSSLSYIHPQEPFAHSLSNKNILFQVFRI